MMRILAVASAYSLAAASLVWSAAALALGLGDVDVRSRLNERFAASIPLDSASPEDLESLTVTIASAEEFARRGLDRNDLINALRFELSGNAIKVASAQPVRDPFLNFIIEARWNGGRLLREYTVLLDPPASAPPPVGAAQAPEAAASPAPKAAIAPVTEAAAAVADLPVRYGPVKPAQTLWSIATLFRRDPSVTMDQMLLAIYNMNPTAFGGGSINQLLSGQMLIVPGAEDALAIDADAARDRVARLRAANAAAPVAPRKPAVVPPSAPAPVLKSEPEPAPEPVPATAPATAESVPAAPATPPAAATPLPDVQTPETTTELPAADVNSVEIPAPAENPADSAAAEVAPEAVVPPAADMPATEVPAAAAPAAALAADVAAITDQDALPWLPIAAVALLVLALVGFKLWQRRSSATRRKGSSNAAARDMLDAGPDLLMEQPWARATVAQALAEPAVPPSASAAEVVAEPTDERDETASEAAPVIADIATDERQSELDKPDAGPGLEVADPLTEADFHLAYGLYDEAAQMLQNAIAAAPERGDLKMKLAETYSAAGNATAFQTLAESMIDTASPADWQKISVMGRALLPASLLFGGLPADVDVPAEVATAPRDLSVIDFDLDIDPARGEPLLPEVALDAPLDVPVTAEAEIAPVPIPDPLTESLLRPLDEPIVEFDLPPATPPQPVTAAPAFEPLPEPVPMAAARSDDAVIDIDLSSFDLDDDGSNARTESSPVPSSQPFLEIPLDESAFEVVPEPESEVIGGDEIDTKLDLARAYADMGDLDAARTLIAEVENAGNDKQQQEARALSQRLLG